MLEPKINNSRNKIILSLTALGVVYGDIGTSPLYALKEAFHLTKILPTPDNVMGILSLIIWSLFLVISVKYLTFILRADYFGEGGILALLSLIQSSNKQISPFIKTTLTFLAVLGAAFLYGDGIITPAISILSAIEGLSFVTPLFNPYIIPITIAILITLFSFQKKGTNLVGRIFGPITLVWFLAIGLIGFFNILKNYKILFTINPFYGIDFFIRNSFEGFAVLGAIFLVVTGGEALYSDLGHFGIEPIKKTWFRLVLPCLLLNYWGQGSYLLNHPEGVSNPFYLMAPSWLLPPLVVLATLATTIAAQALITGVFSITMQAVQQGFLPRIHVLHTSKTEFGQIYIKNVNYFLLLGSTLLVLIFQTSSNLASAYGIAVTLTMTITTILFYFVSVNVWNWNKYFSFTVCSFFILIDLTFLSSNLLKIKEGGWLPITLGIIGFIYMTSWKEGRQILSNKINEKYISINDFLLKIKKEKKYRNDGVGVFMTRNLDGTPLALIQSAEHFQSVHKYLVFASVVIKAKPQVLKRKRYELKEIQENCYQLIINFGYLEKPNIPIVFDEIKKVNPIFDKEKVSFFIGRENIFSTELKGMAIWREKLFSIMSKNEIPATQYFKLPRDRVVEIGTQVEI